MDQADEDEEGVGDRHPRPPPANPPNIPPREFILRCLLNTNWYPRQNLNGIPFIDIYSKVLRMQFHAGIFGHHRINRVEFRQVINDLLENNEIDRVHSNEVDDFNFEAYRYTLRNENRNDMFLQMQQRALEGLDHHRLQQIHFENEYEALEPGVPGLEALTLDIPDLGLLPQELPELTGAQVRQEPVWRLGDVAVMANDARLQQEEEVELDDVAAESEAHLQHEWASALAAAAASTTTARTRQQQHDPGFEDVLSQSLVEDRGTQHNQEEQAASEIASTAAASTSSLALDLCESDTDSGTVDVKQGPVMANERLQEEVVVDRSILKALETNAYPDGPFKNSFRPAEEVQSFELSPESLEQITTEINNSGTTFTQQTWKYLRELPDVKNLFSQDVLEQSLALRSLSQYFKKINWPNFLKYIEKEIPLLAKFADCMRTWIDEYKEDQDGRNPSFDDLAQFHATLCTDPRFNIDGKQMIYKFQDIWKLEQVRGTDFGDDFLVYSFYMDGYEDGQHNGKVFGKNMKQGYCGDLYTVAKCKRWNLMMPPGTEVTEDNWEQARGYRDGVTLNLFQFTRDVNRNMYGRDEQRRKYPHLNLLAHNVIEVFFVLMNSGWISINEHPGNGYFGDSTYNIPDIDKFNTWLEAYGSFIREYQHNPANNLLLPSTDHPWFRNPKERQLATYYSAYYNRKMGGLRTEYHDTQIKEMMVKSHPVQDHLGQDIFPNHVCRYCKRRFLQSSFLNPHTSKCQYEMTDEEAELMMKLVAEYATFSKTGTGKPRVGWIPLCTDHWRKFENAYRRHKKNQQGLDYNIGICVKFLKNKNALWTSANTNFENGLNQDPMNLSKLRYDKLAIVFGAEIIKRNGSVKNHFQVKNPRRKSL